MRQRMSMTKTTDGDNRKSSSNTESPSSSPRSERVALNIESGEVHNITATPFHQELLSTTLSNKGILRCFIFSLSVLCILAYGISSFILEVTLTLTEPDSNIMASTKATPTTVTNHDDGKELQHVVNLKFATMNIAGLEPSQSAPSSWTFDLQKKAVLGEILKTDPDFIALQEVPTANGANSGILFDHDDTTYQFIGSVPSHAGYVSLLVRSEIPATRLNNVPRNYPIVAGMLSMKNDNRDHWIVVASFHLAPFEHGSLQRADQIQTLIKAAQDAGADALVLLGDTNMRETEDESAEALGLVDGWKQAGSPPEARYSWDTMMHNGEQNLYYGSRTRAYQQRYDRVYIANFKTNANGEQSRQHEEFGLEMPTFELLANRPIAPSRFQFLSDHFGIATKLRLTWKTV